MTPEERAAYINSQVSLMGVEAAGMSAENLRCAMEGKPAAYGKASFDDLLARYDHLTHNAVIAFLQG